MRRKISLYIDDSLVDLDEESFILFNYSREEAGNPTIVRNSYSQVVNLPASANNNRIFKSSFRLDGTSFNALAKVPFVVYSELNEVLERGYARLDGIDKRRNGAMYKVSLFGGLGGFFYSLMYDADGQRKTLASLKYYLNRERDPEALVTPSAYDFPLTKDAVKGAWDFLEEYDENYDINDLVNFAPCNNGFPTFKFSTDKATYRHSTAGNRFPNLYNSMAVEEDSRSYTYATKPGMNGNLLIELEHNHTEWEVEDLRAYAQRPVIHFCRLIEALEIADNTGEYTFRIDRDSPIFDSPYWSDLWMTLPIINRDKVDPTTTKLSDIFAGTATPAEYLISFAKLFGLCFVMDKVTNTITLTQRNSYYRDEIIDLSDRVLPEKEISPVLVSSRFYDFTYPTIVGEYPKRYAEKFGRDYGLLRLNTNYDFNDEKETPFDALVFRGCADTLETAINFRYCPGTIQGQYGQSIDNDFKFAFSEKVSWKLFTLKNDEGTLKQVEKEFEPLQSYFAFQPYSTSGSFEDFMSRPQLHGEDNKGEDGSNVLLFLQGFVGTPANMVNNVAVDQARFHLSDDTAEMLELNGGQPCYDVSYSGANILPVWRLPSFRRWKIEDGMAVYSLDPGNPLEVAVPETLDNFAGVYSQGWSSYLADRYDKDAKVVKVKVDLSGMEVGEELLRRFYYFDNSLWSLNKITNYSLSTYGEVECEFVKVIDKNNYLFGQLY